eukprot:gene21838-28866_t
MTSNLFPWRCGTGKESLKSGLNIPGVAESYDEGGNGTTARVAQGFKAGESPL